jgi:arsenite methyltransferase
MAGEELREAVRKRYGEIAETVTKGGSDSCCGSTANAAPSCCGTNAADGDCSSIITSKLYSEEELAALPELAKTASLGCGDPTALAELHAGEIVLDLGSGGGIDVILSAQRVGPAGKAYGLDMTDAMLALARENQRKAGVANAEFLKGEIECIPLPDNSVNVIISNCVINLSADKRQVLAEAFRVLQPGGRFAVSDIVRRGAAPAEILRNLELHLGCIAGALEESDYRSTLTAVGFEAVEIEPTRIYGADDERRFVDAARGDAAEKLEFTGGRFMSACVRARKPGASAGLR